MDRQANKQIQTDKQTDRQTDRRTDKQADRRTQIDSQTAFTLEGFMTKMVRIDTVLTYRLHTNNENAREKRLLPNPLLKVNTCKTMPQFLHINSKNDRVVENDSALANVHVVSHGLQSHNCHVLVIITSFLRLPVFSVQKQCVIDTRKRCSTRTIRKWMFSKTFYIVKTLPQI